MKLDFSKAEVFGGIITLFGAAVLTAAIVKQNAQPDALWIGVAVMAFGAILATGYLRDVMGTALGVVRRMKGIPAGPDHVIDLAPDSALGLRSDIKRKELEPEQREQAEEFVRTKVVVPAADKPRYSAIDQVRVSNLLIGPSAHPMTPMYLLDKDFRILEWNEAFSLAFDRTMEGRQGNSILEWTYHLDNYEEVLNHGSKIFGNPDHFPCYDQETVVYTSLRYGRITATKHAYQIVGNSGHCEAWLITLAPEFEDRSEQSRYRSELLQLIGLDQLWSEYAISYDQVLTNTRVYRDLIDTVIGIKGEPLASITNDATILDMGAGTGNVSCRLMQQSPKRLVFALDNNSIMLEYLRDKCRDYLREDDLGAGVLPIKQDVTSLYGLQDDYFDYVIANNVFYALADPRASLEAAFRVLKPGGELRATGPRRDTDIDALFQQIRKDLEAEGKFDDCQRAYEHVEQINKLRLRTMLHQWDTDEFCELIQSEGFEIKYRDDNIYAGQSMLVTAVKPGDKKSGTLSEVRLKIK